MNNSRFSEDQIVAILKQHKAGRKIRELSQEHCASETTIYKWRSQFSGMDVNGVRVEVLAQENRRLRHLVGISCSKAIP